MHFLKIFIFFLDEIMVVLCAQEELGEHTVHEVVVASPVTSFPGFPSFSESLRANADFSPQIFSFFSGYSIDVKIHALSIYEVFRAIPALLPAFWEPFLSKKFKFHGNLMKLAVLSTL